MSSSANPGELGCPGPGSRNPRVKQGFLSREGLQEAPAATKVQSLLDEGEGPFQSLYTWVPESEQAWPCRRPFCTASAPQHLSTSALAQESPRPSTTGETDHLPTPNLCKGQQRAEAMWLHSSLLDCDSAHCKCSGCDQITNMFCSEYVPP